MEGLGSGLRFGRRGGICRFLAREMCLIDGWAELEFVSLKVLGLDRE